MGLRRPIVVAVVSLLVWSSVAGPVAGLATTGAGYDLTIDGSIDIPTRTVEVQDDTYNISSLAQVDKGEIVSADATVPENVSEYSVRLYNNDLDLLVRYSDLTGNSTVEFDTTFYSPGTYLVVIYYDGEFRDIHPLTIAAYNVSTTSPAEFEQGGETNVTVSLTRKSYWDGSLGQVQVVVGNDSHTVRVNATAVVPDERYEAQVPTGSLSDGEYRVYGVVRGTDDTAYGRKEILATSTGTPVSVVNLSRVTLDAPAVSNVGAETPAVVNTSGTVGAVTNVTVVGAGEAATGERVGTDEWRGAVTFENDTWNGTAHAETPLSVAIETESGIRATFEVTTTVYIGGDVNGDRTVNIFDAVALGNAWQSEPGEDAYSDAADLTNDGSIDIFDAVALGNNWQNES